jgi:hypothetical protein
LPALIFDVGSCKSANCHPTHPITIILNFCTLVTTACTRTTLHRIASFLFFIMSSNQFDAQASTNYKEAFALFDKRGNGRVTLESLGDLLRACGQNPTLAEIQDLEKNVGGDCTCSLPTLDCDSSLRPDPATRIKKREC